MDKPDRIALFVWLLLVIMTLATYTLDRLGASGPLFVTILMLAATIKGQLLADWFMALKPVRSWWRWVVTGWLLGVVCLIGLAYWVGEQ